MGGKLKATLLLLLMYGLGVGSGVAWETYHSHHHSHKVIFGERRIARLKKQLNLNPWQEESLREIVQDARERAKDLNEAMELDLTRIHEDSLDAIHELLTPDQQHEFEKLHQHWLEKHKNQLANPPVQEPETPQGANS